MGYQGYQSNNPLGVSEVMPLKTGERVYYLAATDSKIICYKLGERGKDYSYSPEEFARTVYIRHT